jgi:hypothetical protein
MIIHDYANQYSRLCADDDLYEDPNDNKFVDVIKSSEEGT